MTHLNKKLKYSIIGTAILAPMLFSYFYGPKSELTLLSRLHYNALFVYTPCLGRLETFDDGAVKFNYRRPPAMLSHTAVLIMNPFNRGTETFRYATEAISLDIPTGYAYKFKPPAGKPFLLAPVRTIKLKKGSGGIRIGGPAFKDYGPEFLYLSGKNGYTYEIELPFYLERMVDRSWIFPALYHSGILSMLGSFTNLLPPRGFFKWFFTPCADKQLYCSGEIMLKSIEVSE